MTEEGPEDTADGSALDGEPCAPPPDLKALINLIEYIRPEVRFFSRPAAANLDIVVSILSEALQRNRQIIS